MDTNALSTSTRRAFAPPRRRLWAVLAAVVIVAGVLLASATQPGSVLAGSTTSIVIAPTATSITAGGSQTYTATGFNNGGISTGNVTAETTFTTTPTAGGATVGCAGSACGPTVAGTYTVIATHVDGASISTTLTVTPGPAANATFSHPPIATEKGTPIYSACRPPSGGAAPCAVSGSTATDSTSVRVYVTDAFGNAILPQTVTVTAPLPLPLGTTVLGSDTTENGVADFADSLSIGAVGNYTLTAQVTSGPTSARPSTSAPVAIVNDLQACTGNSCANNANNGLEAKRLQRAYGEITTTSTFFDSENNVLLTTQFVPGTETSNQCGSNATIGQAVDMTVSGAGTSATAPTTQMLLVIPRDALKFYGIASRGTGTFEVCLGALNISEGSVTPWLQKKVAKKAVTLVDSNLVGDRYWGVPADCGTANLPETDPCIGLRTKNVSQVQSYMGLTAAEITAIGVRDSDLMIVIDKQFPWDGKGGVY